MHIHLNGTLLLAAAALLTGCSAPNAPSARAATAPIVLSGNPILPGWYADPEAIVWDNTYWIYPTTSARYDAQTHFDCFSSTDLITWTKHPKILEKASVSWARRAMWGPAITKHQGKYFLFFGANDIQKNSEIGGIGVAVSDSPSGPFKDHLGTPLIDAFHNGAQPIDQAFFRDTDAAAYLIYGGWRHCNIVRLNDDFTGLIGEEVGQWPRQGILGQFIRDNFANLKDDVWQGQIELERANGMPQVLLLRGSRATAARTHGQRIPVLPAPGLPGVGAG